MYTISPELLGDRPSCTGLDFMGTSVLILGSKETLVDLPVLVKKAFNS